MTRDLSPVFTTAAHPSLELDLVLDLLLNAGCEGPTLKSPGFRIRTKAV